MPSCFCCGEPTNRSCGNCRLRYYCGRACQRLDWPAHKNCEPAPKILVNEFGGAPPNSIQLVPALMFAALFKRGTPEESGELEESGTLEERGTPEESGELEERIIDALFLAIPNRKAQVCALCLNAAECSSLHGPDARAECAACLKMSTHQGSCAPKKRMLQLAVENLFKLFGEEFEGSSARLFVPYDWFGLGDVVCRGGKWRSASNLSSREMPSASNLSSREMPSASNLSSREMRSASNLSSREMPSALNLSSREMPSADFLTEFERLKALGLAREPTRERARARLFAAQLALGSVRVLFDSAHLMIGKVRDNFARAKREGWPTQAGWPTALREWLLREYRMGAALI